MHEGDGFVYLSDLSPWDTFRTLHPWYELADPDIDIIVLTEGAYRGLVSMRMLMAHSKDLLATSFAEVSALEEKARRLEEINRLQQEFVANMTHELRTPLNTIIGISRLALKDPELSAHRQRDLEVMLRRGMDLLGIVNDMLDLYKIESGEMTPVIEEFDLHELLEDLAGSFAYLLENRPVELLSDFVGSPRMLSTDPVMLKRVLTNLLSNAVKFTEEGSVSLIASAHNGHVLIEVRDTGMGIKREDRERLFKKFSQLEAAATKRHGGTGLGLAIVQQLSEMLGGSVRLESEYGQGSSFTLTLPR